MQGKKKFYIAKKWTIEEKSVRTIPKYWQGFTLVCEAIKKKIIVCVCIIYIYIIVEKLVQYSQVIFH